MSRAQDGQRTFFPVGNPFRMILPRGSHLSPKLAELLASYEEGLALSLRRLKPEDTSEVLTLSWMKLAVDSLSELHTNIATLITELKLPVSDWDEKWVDIYLNSSVKLLDICTALSSELARLDQGQLLVRYVLHVLDSGSDVPSSEQLGRAEASLKEWMERASMKSPRLQDCSALLQELSGNLSLMKVKHSAKGKVLMRALYGVEAVTVSICSVLVSLLSGSTKPLMKFDIPEKFGWSKAFSDLYSAVGAEVRWQSSRSGVVAVKELEELEACARKLHALASVEYQKESANLACAVIHSVEVARSDAPAQEGVNEDRLKLADDTTRECQLIMGDSIAEVKGEVVMKQVAKTSGHQKEVMMLEVTGDGQHQDDNMKHADGTETNGLVRREELLNCISNLSKSAEGLRLSLDSVSRRVGNFFHIVLTGRDALLCNLRISDESKVATKVS
jgi:hypothetical protein